MSDSPTVEMVAGWIERYARGDSYMTIAYSTPWSEEQVKKYMKAVDGFVGRPKGGRGRGRQGPLYDVDGIKGRPEARTAVIRVITRSSFTGHRRRGGK